MDTNRAFDDKGVYEIPNPNYKKGSKKQPKTIPTDNFFLTSGANTASEVKLFNKAASDVFQMTDTQKYSEYGITPNTQSKSLNDDLAKAQSNWAKAGNALLQTAWSEVALGTAKGLSDLFDFVGHKIGLSDHDYSNPLSQYLEEAQEQFRKDHAIYVKEGVDIANGGLTNFGWWMNNMPSIASSLTLLVPSMGVVKGLSYLGKVSKLGAVTRTAVKAASKLSGSSKLYRALNSTKAIELGNLAVENGLNAILQRTMENYQEARGVYNDMYKEAKDRFDNMSDKDYQEYIAKHENDLQGIDVDNRDEVAKHVSRTSADEDFKNNYANTVFDVIEMYALRDALSPRKSLMNIGRKSVNKAQREALRYAGKTAEEIAEIKAARGFLGKASDFTKDALLGSGLVITAQLSEGAEEAINYISQQEAMDTGRVMLGTSSNSTFDTRLKSYLTSPQLWESAFWGVMGGVIFQEAGSRLRRVSNNLKNKNSGEEVDPVTGEVKAKAEWSLNDELPEVQRRIAEIKGREAKLTLLSQKLDAIKQGKNPNNPDSSEKLSEQEIKVLQEQTINDAIVDMALTAMNNGNTKLLQEYFKDENVRKALVEQGIVSEESSKDLQRKATELIDEVVNQYEDDLLHLTDLSADIDTEDKQILPYEVLQLIATDNVKYRRFAANMAIGRQKALEEYQRQVADAKSNGKLNPNIDYDSALQVRGTIWALQDLYTERERLVQANRKNPSIGNSLAIDKINGQITRLQTELHQADAINGVNNLLYAMTQLSLTRKSLLERDKDGNIVDKVGLEEIKTLDKAIKQALDKNDFTGINSIFDLKDQKDSLDEVNFKAFKERSKSIRQNVNKVLAELDRLGVKKNSINEAYNTAYSYGFQEAVAKSNIVITVDELQRNVRTINNTLSEVRSGKLNEASKVFEEMLEKYGRRSVEAGMESSRINDAIIKLRKLVQDCGFTDMDNAKKLKKFWDANFIRKYKNYADLEFGQIWQALMA